MKKTLLMLVLAAAATGAVAGDDKMMMPIAAAMAANGAPEKLAGVQFYFAGQSTPAILENLGTDKTSQKTNAVGKSAETACNWVFLSNMLSLHKRAIALGANAVVNIRSNYKNVENPSATEFECHEGTLMTGVALKADFVKIADKQK